MYITDLNGCEIEITDLKEAIKIAKRNTGYNHEDKSFSEFDKRQKAYWTDISEKLTAIKKQVTTIKILER
ncbi:hypothetical protein GCM10027516_20550 [Niabella aquatica]